MLILARCVTRSLVLYACFVDRCLSLCTFSFGHCGVCPSSIYGFWLPLWYLQTLPVSTKHAYKTKDRVTHLASISIKKPLLMSTFANEACCCPVAVSDPIYFLFPFLWKSMLQFMLFTLFIALCYLGH
jgi:hypothetical protein